MKLLENHSLGVLNIQIRIDCKGSLDYPSD